MPNHHQLNMHYMGQCDAIIGILKLEKEIEVARVGESVQYRGRIESHWISVVLGALHDYILTTFRIHR